MLKCLIFVYVLNILTPLFGMLSFLFEKNKHKQMKYRKKGESL